MIGTEAAKDFTKLPMHGCRSAGQPCCWQPDVHPLLHLVFISGQGVAKESRSCTKHGNSSEQEEGERVRGEKSNYSTFLGRQAGRLS